MSSEIEFPRIVSPMPRGSGAIVVHDSLAHNLPGYHVAAYDPRLEFFPFLMRRLRDPSADIVHSTADHGAWFAMPGQRLVVTFHNFVLDDGMRDYSSIFQRLHYRTDLLWSTKLALQKAVAVTAVSRFTADAVRDFFGLERPIRVIENGIDTEFFSPVRRPMSDVVRVLVSGNASLRKGTHLLKAIAGKLAPGVEIYCTLSQDVLRKWGCDLPNVRALGKIPAHEMASAYQNADILLMPTAREGFGLAVAEAMACGIPVVASDTSTMPDLIAHEDGGYLCSLDEPEQFARRINQLAAAPDLRARMGQFNRRAAVARFSVERMVAGYRSVFAEVMSAR